ncbi:MAG TPA: hypothetical protein VEG38_11020 [Acidimicrobiia bacterium]|nr:hypothetical protein [Acidimicrobiia bacterium]
MKLRTLTIAAVLIFALAAGPATAAPARPSDRATGSWAGQVVRHDRHFDYQGSYCPTKEQACIKIFAKFRIVPLNPRAAAALHRVSGGPAKLFGWRAPASDGEHNGILYVRRVKKA